MVKQFYHYQYRKKERKKQKQKCNIAIYRLAKDCGKSFFRLYIYTNWQKIMAKCFLDFIYMIWQNHQANRFERLYIQIGKIIRQIV